VTHDEFPRLGDAPRRFARKVREVVARVLGLVLFVSLFGGAAAPVALPAPAQRQQAVAVLDAGVLGRLNAIRVANGLRPLHLSPSLSAAAAFHSHELAAAGYFSHESADGTVFWKRIERWYAPARSGTWSVGENLLWSSPDIDASQALAAWMSSPEHRANILDASWREIGIAAIHVDRAGGVYHDRPVTIITTDFGSRS
jgi:uncharacterized protein YkwD